jgi:hypothetical protein
MMNILSKQISALRSAPVRGPPDMPNIGADGTVIVVTMTHDGENMQSVVERSMK